MIFPIQKQYDSIEIGTLYRANEHNYAFPIEIGIKGHIVMVTSKFYFEEKDHIEYFIKIINKRDIIKMRLPIFDWIYSKI